MKTLLLLFVFISCGHEEPNALDLQDDDGDTIANTYEAGMGRYIAKMNPLPQLEGKIEIAYSKGKKDVLFSEFKFEKNYSRRVLSGDSNLKVLPLFRERGLQLSYKSNMGDMRDDEIVDLTLAIPPSTPEFEEIYFVHKNLALKLGALRNGSRLTLKGADCKMLVRNEAFLAVTNSNDEYLTLERVANQTRRVFVEKEGKTNIYYVSKKLPLDQLETYLELGSKAQNILGHDFFLKNKAERNWWYRDSGIDADSAFAYGSVQDFRSEIMTMLNWKHGSTTRLEGVLQQKASFNLGESNVLQKKLLIKIQKNSHRYRNFGDKIDYQRWLCRRGEDTCECSYRTRWIASESDHSIDLDYLKRTLLIRANGIELNFNDILQHERTEFLNGVESWIFVIDLNSDNIEFDLQPGKLGLGFIGTYDSGCHKPGNGTSQISVESTYDLKIAILQLQ